jgi:hypothetical protein
LAILLAGVSLLTACSAGSADDGMKTAVQACNEALTKNTGLDGDGIIARDKSIADKAAKAAASSDKWKDLAKAASDWALIRQDFIEAKAKLESGQSISWELQQMSTRVDGVRAELIAACRGVKAAGGNVDESLLNSI